MRQLSLRSWSVRQIVLSKENWHISEANRRILPDFRKLSKVIGFMFLIEHFAGKFPFWMSPLPIRLIPVTDRHSPYAQKVMHSIRQAGFLCDCDSSAESVSKKVRNAQLLRIWFKAVPAPGCWLLFALRILIIQNTRSLFLSLSSRSLFLLGLTVRCVG